MSAIKANIMSSSPSPPRWSEGTGLPFVPNIPRRTSSNVQLNDGSANTQGTLLANPPPPPPHRSSVYEVPVRGSTVRSKGRSSSPLRQPDSSTRVVSSRTFVPDIFPADLLYAPKLSHARLLIDLRLSSPIFVGGATVEGEIHLVVDGGPNAGRRKSPYALSICRITVTIVGIERCKGKKEIFRALTTEMLDINNPLPLNMQPVQGDGQCWSVVPSSTILPFRVDLPIMMGPPPYESKRSGVKYIASTTIEFDIGKRKHFARQSKDIVVLTVHDPEKALVNLASPLLVSDELHYFYKQLAQRVVLTAGIHRQTWIGGYPIFVDVQIDNESSKAIRKIEMQLERSTIFYTHSAPSTSQGLAGDLRLPDKIYKEVIARKDVSAGLPGIVSISQDIKTYQIDLPPGTVSVETGRFFGVRFFINIQLSLSFKKLKVQLPVTIIHPNSIDIPTNALAQVTASIEHKHRNLASASGTGSPYHYKAGQAFATARRKSFIHLHEETIKSAEIQSLTERLENSPRRLERKSRAEPRKMTITRRQSAAPIYNAQALVPLHTHVLSRQHASFDNGVNRRDPRLSNDTTRIGEPRVSFEDATKFRSEQQQRSSLETKVHKGLRGRSFDASKPEPRLQKSTSGLGFDFPDDSDKENRLPRL